MPNMTTLLRKEDLPALITGMMATLAGIGIARFAYTPLLSEVVQHDWFSDSQAVYLGAANLLGYLIGALSAHALSERISVRGLMGFSFAAIALSFLLCAQPGNFEWFFLWRLIAGITGAILMVVGPATALSRTASSHRAGVATLVFTGIGLGAALSALAVPLSLQFFNLSSTWIALGVLSLFVWLVFDRGFIRLATVVAPPSATPSTTEAPVFISSVIILVFAAYALDAVGFVPHTIFWVDYLVREQALGTAAGSLQWALFGTGAVFGPLVAGLMAKRFCWHQALNLAFLIKAVAVAIPIVSISFFSRSLSSFLVGAMVPGLVALTSGRIAELVGPTEHKRFWGYATAVFALAQAISGYAMSALYTMWGSYYFLFVIGSSVLLIGLLLNTLSGTFSTHKPLIQQIK